ncbi:GNAT family N-acetyltransferase [Polaribacter ponticola]|uniref:GNAT family N-acetyltransferase n=1 Tax=Polaribacter ponticola TaxID=2978475 RepID=A0ABT5S9U0_9FLAO|nr:GNAT family N-acetyltransferase [Polaribacter sp. MSW5]MDD7914875.1 GNAT family N-acetyltransferase [Polaribacter sp. MSW5]
MKEATNTIKENIKNLTSLWTTAGNAFNSHQKLQNFEYSEIKNSEWPNRIWFNQYITQEIIDQIKEKIAVSSSKITVPIWNISNKKQDVIHDAILELNNFKVKFEQIGMSLKTSSLHNLSENVKIKLVSNDFEAKIWSQLFKNSFGYKISCETIINTIKDINYYIAYHNNTAIGTAATHITNNIMGIHSVGIPPEMRRKGYAEQIMKLLINTGVENKYELITLQASNMGKNIYLKLGFKEEFLIKNYILQ